MGKTITTTTTNLNKTNEGSDLESIEEYYRWLSSTIGKDDEMAMNEWHDAKMLSGLDTRSSKT
jgi:hypothetical protein